MIELCRSAKQRRHLARSVTDRDQAPSLCGPGWILLAALLILTPAWSLRAEDGGKRAVLVEVEPATSRILQARTEVFGRLVPVNSGDVPSRISGAIDRINVEVGDKVQKNDVLARLVDARLKALLAAAKARAGASIALIEVEKATLRIAGQELTRLEALRSSAAFPKARYQDQIILVEKAKASLADAQARAQEAKAAVDTARIDIEWSVIKAPYSGTIGRRYRVPGSWAGAGQPVVEMFDSETIEIEAEIPFPYGDYLDVGMEVFYRFDQKDRNGQVFPAFVRAILDREDAVTRTRLARLTIPEMDKGDADAGDRPQSLIIHQPVVLLLPSTKERKALLINKDALLTKPGDGNDANVFVVRDGQAQIRQVTIGESDRNHIEIIDGLADGDIVVTRGNERLIPGQTVRYDMPEARP